ncbi:MAG TPA: isoleucine--tRNA ligase, partial [Thermoplasmatales archaeon]|nr:isoleucine--tRNA ligase [Thermoplasmatales archaeon]
FEENFPVDFICEALDQTRGWFYSLMTISTLLFNRAPYRRVLTLGLVLDKEGQKMSKSKKNYLDPNYIFDREGADAMRWYFLSTNAPWMPIRFYEDAIKETLGKFILTFWNSYRFYKSYSSLDKFDPTRGYIPIDRRREIDRWIISRLQKLIMEVTENVENFNIHKATRAIEEFVIEDLSNWYIRRSRKRLWVEEENEDKLSCYSTLYDVFLTLSKLSAPFIPFLAEVIYQGIRHDDMEESVHLCDYPEVNSSLIDEDMEKAMDVVREIADMGRAIRSRAGVKIRYPLGRAIVVCDENVEKKISPLMGLVKEEINVKSVEFSRDTAEYSKEIEKGDYLIEESEKIKLIMDVRLTPELFAEGFSREIVRRIQSMRKELNLDIEDRINTQIAVDEEKIEPLSKWLDYIRGETRSENIDFTDQPGGDLVKEWKIGDTTVKIGIKKIES